MTLFENKNIKPMNLTFWKEIKEEAGAAGGAGGAASAGVSAGSMASGMAALGGTPTPALAQLSRSGISAATVNGIPVPSQSTRKKKKKKKNEDLILDTTNQNLEIRALITKAIAEENDAITSYLEKAKRCKELGIDKLVDLFNELAKDETVHTGCLQAALDEFDMGEINDVIDGREEAEEIFDKTNTVNSEIEDVVEGLLEDFHEDYITGRELQDWDWQQRQTALYDQIGSPKQIFATGKDEDIPLEFDDAINILLYGKDEDDRREYKELLYLFKDTGRMKEFINYANNKGFKDLSPKVIGKQEESLNIVNQEIEDIVKDLLQEDFHEAYEEITNLLAKQLDRMNFEFANTEDIIYKKEGKYKYLLKFDNKNGFLKFKISKDDNVIEVREWQLDEGQDISPIFKEIEDLYNKYGI